MKTRMLVVWLVVLAALVGALPAAAQRHSGGTETLFGGEADVTFRDDFDDKTLSDGWISTTSQASVDNGFLTLDPSTAASDALLRPGIETNEGVLILFQYTAGTMDFRLETGEEGTQDYRRVSFANKNGWKGQFFLGKSSYDLRYADLDEDTWYYLLLRVDADSLFHMDVWQRDNPVEYDFSQDRTFTQKGFADVSWDFAMHVQKGQLRIARYEELSFRPGFSLTPAPELHPDDVVYTQDFDDLDLNDWFYRDEPTVEEMDGDSALRLENGNYFASDTAFSGANYTLIVDAKVTQLDPKYNSFDLTARLGDDGFYDASLDVGTYLSYIARVDNDGSTLLNRGRGSNLRRSTWHTIRFRVMGDDLKVFVDDHLIVYATDDTFSEGGMGFVVADGAVVYFDNLRIVTMEP